jgi:acid stress-induced BolA-like protein IbaG/YrbA
MPMVTPAAIEGYLKEKLDCLHLAVEGDGAHFQALIVSSAFAGKSRVARHQIVYGALGDRMREEIHALSMQTLTPDEWQASAAHPSH